MAIGKKKGGRSASRVARTASVQSFPLPFVGRSLGVASGPRGTGVVFAALCAGVRPVRNMGGRPGGAVIIKCVKSRMLPVDAHCTPTKHASFLVCNVRLHVVLTDIQPGPKTTCYGVLCASSMYTMLYLPLTDWKEETIWSNKRSKEEKKD